MLRRTLGTALPVCLLASACGMGLETDITDREDALARSETASAASTPHPDSLSSASPSPSPSASPSGSPSAAPSTLALSGTTSVTSSSCAAFTLQLKDSSGSPAGATASTTATLSGGAASLFYSDSACATSITTKAFASGEHTQAFYLKDTSSATITLTAQTSGVASTSLAVTLASGPPISLTLSGYSNPRIWTCTGPITIQALDYLGNRTASSAVPVTLSANASIQPLAFQESDCFTASPTITIAAGSTGATAYLLTQFIGSFTLTAGDASGRASSATLGTNSLGNRTLSTGGDATCAALPNGTIKCWGRNSSGILGMEDSNDRGTSTTPLGSSQSIVNVGSGRTVMQMAVGGPNGFACALLDNLTAKCWGNGAIGQLGNGSAAIVGDSPSEMGDSLNAISLGSGRSVYQIAAGNSTGCALLDNRKVKCWGEGANGANGNGSTVNLGLTSQEMGDNLAYVNLGTNRTARSISFGANHVCAILDTKELKCWGDNSFAQLGIASIYSPIGDNISEMGDGLPAISIGTNRAAQAVAAGSNFTCVLRDEGSVRCWGSGAYGQTGHENSSTYGWYAGDMGVNIPATDLGVNRTALSIAASAGGRHACAILDTGELKCWGDNFYGQLGLGDSSDRGMTPGSMGVSLVAVSLGTGRRASAVDLGTNHTCALLDTEGVKCWGVATSGQIGMNDANTRGYAAGQMGDCLQFLSGLQ